MNELQVDLMRNLFAAHTAFNAHFVHAVPPYYASISDRVGSGVNILHKEKTTTL